MTTPANNQNQTEGLTPESLANKLFDIALSQGGTTDPEQLSQQVIDFLGGALVYALTSAKRDVVIFFTETLLYFAAHSSPDPAQRAAVLKQISDAFAHAAAAPAAASPPGAPVGAPPSAVPPAAAPPVGTPPGVPTPPKP